MPARKSNASVGDDESGLSVEDLNLPKTMVNRLAKGALPANFNVQAVAQSAISKSATVFVNYLTAHASDIAARQNKKTIQPKDVLDALKELEFDMFVKRTNDELIKYTEIQCTKRNSYRRRVKDEKRAAEGTGGPTSGASSMEAGPDSSIIRTGEDGVGQSSAEGGAGATNGHVQSLVGEFAKRPRLDLAEDDDQDMDADEGENEGEDEGEDEEGQDEEEDEEEDEEGEEGDEGDREDLLEEKEDKMDEDEAMDGEESD
ncbi:histone-fold-containing protein [Phyllosticta citricarpa]